MTYHSHTWVVATRRGNGHPRRVTIADVAKEAGVNKGTASRALRGFAGVGADTRDKILEAADRLQFTASHIATALATGLSQTVGIVLPTLGSWYFSEVASGASSVLTRSGYRVELINLDIDSDFLDVDSEEFRRLFRELGRGRDGLLFAGTIFTEPGSDMGYRVPAAATGLPLNSVPGMVIDQYEGMRLLTQHLLSLGHRHFSILDGSMPERAETWVWEQRTAGILDTLSEAGVRLGPDRLLHPGDCHAQDGERAMSELLATGETLPTAILCHTDELAFGVLSAMRQAGLRAPEDISVAGFDDHPMSRFWGLTTVSQHAHDQGVRAAMALIQALGGVMPPTVPVPSAELRVSLRVRETTARPAR